MGFNPSGGNISGAGDVALNNPANSQVLTYNSALAKWQNQNAASGGTPGATRTHFLTVASSALPTAAKNACDYICDGVNDQVQINAALRRASRPGDGFSNAEGYIGVCLVGPYFSIADDNTTSITMYPSTTLMGSGSGTLLEPKWTGNPDRGCIELLNAQTAHVTVKDLAIGRHNAVTVPGHGIKFDGDGTGNLYEIKTGNDPFNSIHNVWVLATEGKGIWLTGSGGGSRAAQVSYCVVWNSLGECIEVDGSSDASIAHCQVNGAGVGVPGFRIGGGNTQLADCKAYYSEGATGSGYVISSSRCEIRDCASQDAGGWGFEFTGQDVSATGLVADSNSRESASAGGFRIAADGIYTGLHAFDRAQTPASPQLKAIEFSNSPQVYLDARTRIPSGGMHISGSPSANSYIRVVRDATTVYSIG